MRGSLSGVHSLVQILLPVPLPSCCPTITQRGLRTVRGSLNMDRAVTITGSVKSRQQNTEVIPASDTYGRGWLVPEGFVSCQSHSAAETFTKT